MGWSSGTELAERLEKILDRELDFDAKYRVGRKIVAAFEDFDADGLEECSGFIGDAANLIRAKHGGAPRDPQEGDEAEIYDELHRWDGRRWRYCDD